MTECDATRFRQELDRRRLLQLGAGALIGLGIGNPAGAAAPAVTGAHGRHPVMIDGLGGLENPNLPPPADTFESDRAITIDARTLADGHASGICAFNQTIGYVAGSKEPFDYSVADIVKWDDFIHRHAVDLIKVENAADIRRAHQTGKIGIILGFQNAAMMGQDIKRVNLFAKLGIRVIQLTYNVRNQLGDGAMAPENQGLTEFGRAIVHELNQNKVMVDLGHSGEQTCLDAIAESQRPISINHTGCRALADLPRNKSDRELRLVAEKGGIVGIYFMPFLAIDRQPTAVDLIAHIEHALQICGEDHVTIGTDGALSAVDDMNAYRQRLAIEVAQRKAAGVGAKGERGDIVTFLPDLQGPTKFWRLADMLEKRGHKPDRVDKILGGNFLRFAEAIWG